MCLAEVPSTPSSSLAVPAAVCAPYAAGPSAQTAQTPQKQEQPDTRPPRVSGSFILQDKGADPSSAVEREDLLEMARKVETEGGTSAK